jgi:hypothetical protein
VRYDRGVLESFVDLTYRGLLLGRRIRLTQIRPSTGYLELPAPMPVGAQIAITAEDGVAFDAIVTAIHEQISGSDRAPGMTVAPALGEAPAAAWWTSRVALPEDESLRRRPVTASGRSRPPTVRPRSHTSPTPPPAIAAAAANAPATDEVPTIIADLEARVTAAAGLAPARVDDPHGASTLVMPMHEIEAIAAQARPDSEPPAMRRTGEHEVVDDGNHTTIMDSMDPAVLGFDLAAIAGHGAAGRGAGDVARDRGDTRSDADEPQGDDGDDGDDNDVTDPGDPGQSSDTLEDNPPAQPGGGRRKRKLRR